jgi:hypothetical protein
MFAAVPRYFGRIEPLVYTPTPTSPKAQHHASKDAWARELKGFYCNPLENKYTL